MNPELPDGLEHIIDKALEKDREVRHQSAKDLLADLKRLKRDTDSGKSAASVAVDLPTPQTSRVSIWTAATAAVVLIVAAALVWFWPSSVVQDEVFDSVAVLLENRSGNAEMEYLSDGIAQGIINRLSQLPSLEKVTSWSTVRRYKGKDTDAQTLAEDLEVRAVLPRRHDVAG